MTDGLAETLGIAWDMLEHGARDPSAPARTVAVASVGADNRAEVRMMVLRRASRTAARLEVHADAATSKTAEFAVNARGTVLVWDPGTQMQIRVRVTAVIRTGEDAAEAWDRMPESVRARYGGTLPGASLAGPDDGEATADPDRFAVIGLAVDEIETLVLGHPHRRAIFRATDGFAGEWIAP